ncbi:hypothetical protein CARUB_v100277370mg, partial [Capsella rubella]
KEKNPLSNPDSNSKPPKRPRLPDSVSNHSQTTRSNHS